MIATHTLDAIFGHHLFLAFADRTCIRKYEIWQFVLSLGDFKIITDEVFR